MATTEAPLTIYWTTDLVEQMPHVEGARYEIIDGELFVTTQPHTNHQKAVHKIGFQLELWIQAGGSGQIIPAPGLIYAADRAVAPDLVWCSTERSALAVGADGKLHASPELVVELLSPGKTNEDRDRELKLKLYSRQGVDEYWIVDWCTTTIEVYRRDDADLTLAQTLQAGDTIGSPLLPGFTCVIDRFFEL